METLKRRSKKTIIGILGGIVLVIGIICIPYPGPGWLIVFAGLGILSTEFDWAQRLLDVAKTKYDAWNVWIKRQNRFMKSLTFILTCIVVIATIWLVNGYGLLNQWFNLGQDWVISPLFR
jgi:uncharacterized protein (TIGR02611 family)